MSQVVEFLDLLARYPCGGPGSQWVPSDADPEISPACGRWVSVGALIEPDQ